MKKLKPMSKSKNKNRNGVPSKLSGRSTTKVKQSKQSKTSKEIRHVQKKSPKATGQIHFVHPYHVVDSKERLDYKRTKGNTNKRPVAIVKQNIDKTVSVAKITSTKPKKSNIQKGHKVELEHTKMPKKSWIDTSEITKSHLTGKQFKANKTPLNNKSKFKLNPKDIKKRNIVIKNKKSK